MPDRDRDSESERRHNELAAEFIRNLNENALKDAAEAEKEASEKKLNNCLRRRKPLR